jgi:hypothetical protein
MDFFLRYFPDKDCDSALLREYNRRMVADFERCAISSCCTIPRTARDDTPFWQWCKNIPLPDTLRRTHRTLQGAWRHARGCRRTIPRLELAVGVRRDGDPAAWATARAWKTWTTRRSSRH